MAFNYKRSITIDHTAFSSLSGNQTNFPFAVYFTLDPSHVGTLTGNDIRFYSDGNLNVSLTQQKKSYHHGTGACSFYVLISTLNISTDVVIWVAYGDASLTSDISSTAVWDSNFLGSWSLGDSSGTTVDLNDYTSNAVNGTNVGAATSASGVNDGAANFDGSSQYITLGNTINPTAMTIEAIINATSFAHTYNATVCRVGTGYAEILARSDGKLAAYFFGNADISYDPGSHTLTAGTDYHVSATYNSSVGLTGYVNGASDGTAAANGNLNTVASNLNIANDPGTGGRLFTGKISDARISNIVRSQDWLKATSINLLNTPFVLGAEHEGSLILLTPSETITTTEIVPGSFIIVFPPMGSVGNIGTAANTSGSTLALIPTTQLNVGNVGIIVVVFDNVSTIDGETNECLSVADNASTNNLYIKLGEWCNSNAAATAGVITAVFMVKCRVAVAITNTITITFSSSIFDKVASMWSFAVAYNLRVATRIPNVTDASTNFGSLTTSTIPNKEYLFFRGMGKQVNSTTQITPTVGHTAITAARSRNGGAAQIVRGEFIINTSTSDTSNPTLAVVGDTSSYLFALEQIGDFLNISPAETITSSELIILRILSFINILESNTLNEFLNLAIGGPGVTLLANALDTTLIGEIINLNERYFVSASDTTTINEFIQNLIPQLIAPIQVLDTITTSELITVFLPYFAITPLDTILISDIVGSLQQTFNVFASDSTFVNTDSNQINMLIPFCPVFTLDALNTLDTFIFHPNDLALNQIDSITFIETINLLVYAPVQPNEAYYRRYLNDLSIA